MAEGEVDELLKASDMNDDGALDFDEFSLLVSRSSPGLEFLRSLPLAELVLDGLPKGEACAGEDPLRKLCRISTEELELSLQAIAEGLAKMLNESLSTLRKSFDLLDSKAATDNSAATKFEIITMSVGNIKDIHDGISHRIGESQFSACVFKCL